MDHRLFYPLANGGRPRSKLDSPEREQEEDQDSRRCGIFEVFSQFSRVGGNLLLTNAARVETKNYWHLFLELGMCYMMSKFIKITLCLQF